MKAHDYEAHRAHNMYYPFADREEWELAKFLSDNLNQGQITRFLKLLWVKSETQKPLAYKSAQQMFTFMDALPKGPKWRCTTIHTEGYITTHPVHLIWRDALEVTWHIFGNPVFANDMEFDPYKIQVNGEREYSEWMSCSQAHGIQDQLPSGATIVPIVLASDKTPVTRQSGGLEMHPMFLTTANIRLDIRMKATLHAWSCIVYMPIPQFICHPDFCSLLQARIWHRRVDIVCENLKITAATGTSMVDPSALHRLCQCMDPWKVQEFQEEAKSLYLSRVQLPFWHNWRFSDPAYFLAPDILHTLHKFFLTISSSGARKQHKHIGTRHFSQGVLHIQQMTGREHRDIQHTIVATLAGVADANFIQAISQSPTFTPSSITAMTSSLAEFHRFKRAIISAEAHRGTSAIPNLGAPIQFTSETSERMLITHCKGPFTRISHQRASFMQQIVCLLDQEDTACQFDLYALLRSKSLSINNLIDNEFEEVVDINPVCDWIMRVSPKEVSRFHSPHPVRNHFLKRLLSEDSRVTFHVTVSSDLADKSPNSLVRLYHLPNFPNLLHAFIERVNGSGSHFQTCLLKVWNKFHLQLHSDLRPHLVMPSQQVQAYPPSGAYPLGNCDMVLLQTQNDDQVVVAQVRMVFGLSTRGSALPPELSEPLLYVQLFEVISRPQDDHVVMMYRVKQWFDTGPDGTRARLRMIVPLVDVTHATELIPEYGQRVNHDVTAATSLELYDTFYLNSFSDKEWYHALHTEFY
ncbi:uncharacterized protein F5147DRAFT_743744 [Suillus discolor]|uniref:DUF6830 domain-containing protein n=1 Tax=Suillus discolor TaxID=1912936 RepID=A0A9P7JY35_9AGAM|nr:uncharacterized protein F5147DRAFT_743744 [Suillus discolor]KAG2115294.1 hypothetical protein F5147DRAFT_743744 [Suillus discolor]